MMTGLFITFEGPDGAGKTTQLLLLADYLRRRGLTVHCTREPGGTLLGDKIRTMLLDPGQAGMSARAEALLYMADRAQHVDELVLPALERGEIVLSDRYSDSTIVYQGVARRLAKDELAAINRFATLGVEPDLTVLLDGEVGRFRSRMVGRGDQDRIEQEDLAFHQAVRQGFLELAKAEPERIKIIVDGGSIDEVHTTVAGLVEEFLQRRGNCES